jgi:hypothetical protein
MFKMNFKRKMPHFELRILVITSLKGLKIRKDGSNSTVQSGKL